MLGTVLAVLSTVMGAAGQAQEGANAEANAKAQAQALKFQAKQLEQMAGETRAAAQRTAMEKEREARLEQSRALAVAAASGAGAFDPTVVRIIAGLAGHGAYEASVALYEGETRARVQELEAQSRRLEAKGAMMAGRSAYEAGQAAAGLTLITGAGSIYGKYGAMDTAKDTGTDKDFGFSMQGNQLPGLWSYK